MVRTPTRNGTDLQDATAISITNVSVDGGVTGTFAVKGVEEGDAASVARHK
jgi:hypothetical protein